MTRPSQVEFINRIHFREGEHQLPTAFAVDTTNPFIRQHPEEFGQIPSMHHCSDDFLPDALRHEQVHGPAGRVK